MAQTTWNYYTVDSASYIQFVNKDYKSLWQTGKKALKNDIDFYYLRTRLGISYYEKENYEQALIHLKKANEMNPADTLIQEYLYFSFVFTNRLEDANDLGLSFSESMKKRVGYKKDNVIDIASSFKSLSITGGGIFNSNISKNRDKNFRQNAQYVENTLQGNTGLVNLYIENKASSRLSFFNSFSYFNVQSMGIVQSNMPPVSKRNYSNPNYQYTLGGTYAAKKNLSIGASFGYFKENSQFLTSDFTVPNKPLTLNTYNSKIAAYTGMVSIFKRYHNIGFGLSQSFGNLSAVTQIQTEGNFLWYPKGNTKFYTSTSLALLKNDGNNQYIITQKIGGKAYKNLWFEVKGSYGNHQNYIANSGIVAYNTIEPIKFTTEANLSIFIKSFKISPSYTLQQRESSYFKIINPTTSQTIKTNYLNHLIKCTLQFNF